MTTEGQELDVVKTGNLIMFSANLSGRQLMKTIRNFLSLKPLKHWGCTVVVVKNPDNEYNPFILTELKKDEWNDIVIAYCIYSKEGSWKQDLLKKLKEQGVPVPHWGFK
jgi:hypothetical protein